MRPAAEQISGVRLIPFAPKPPVVEATLRAEILCSCSIVRRSATDAALAAECLLDPSAGSRAGRKAVMGAGTTRGLRPAFRSCCLLTAVGASQHSRTLLAHAESGGGPHCAMMVAGHIRCDVTATSSHVCGGNKVQVSWCGSPCADSRAVSRRAVTRDAPGAASASCTEGAAALARVACTRPHAAEAMGRRDHLPVEAAGVNR